MMKMKATKQKQRVKIPLKGETSVAEKPKRDFKKSCDQSQQGTAQSKNNEGTKVRSGFRSDPGTLQKFLWNGRIHTVVLRTGSTSKDQLLGINWSVVQLDGYYMTDPSAKLSSLILLIPTTTLRLTRAVAI
jgi:hypothetical protein